MRVLVDRDEWYPVYSVNDHYGDEAELTQEEADRVAAAFAEFDEVQAVLRAAICRVNGHVWKEYRYRDDVKVDPYEACLLCSIDKPADGVSAGQTGL